MAYFQHKLGIWTVGRNTQAYCRESEWREKCEQGKEQLFSMEAGPRTSMSKKTNTATSQRVGLCWKLSSTFCEPSRRDYQCCSSTPSESSLEACLHSNWEWWRIDRRKFLASRRERIRRPSWRLPAGHLRLLRFCGSTWILSSSRAGNKIYKGRQPSPFRYRLQIAAGLRQPELLMYITFSSRQG
jgi:hypothetical protein